jgi:hypothetical protein
VEGTLPEVQDQPHLCGSFQKDAPLRSRCSRKQLSGCAAPGITNLKAVCIDARSRWRRHGELVGLYRARIHVFEQALHGCLLSYSVVLCQHGLDLESALQILLQVWIGGISVQCDGVAASSAPAEPDWISHRPRTTDPASLHAFDYVAALNIFVRPALPH